jgi:hypothetical protein
MNRRVFLVVPALVLTALRVRAQTRWQLITPEEEERDRAAPKLPGPPDLPPPPTITLLRPDLSQPIRNPVTIEIQFSAGPGRETDMQSFNERTDGSGSTSLLDCCSTL